MLRLLQTVPYRLDKREECFWTCALLVKDKIPVGFF